MEFKLHRVAPNSEGWMRPSPGRLGARGVGEYVKENGFGHEDWNFNFGLVFEGRMLGYTVARPAQNLIREKFGVILATYDSQGWKAVGYYSESEFKPEGCSYHRAAVQQMAIDVFELAEKNYVASKYRTMSLSKIEGIIEDEFKYSCWITPKDKVGVFKSPIQIPKRLFNPRRQRMKVSYNILEDQFYRITKLSEKRDSAEEDVDLELEEGEQRLRLHQSRERNPRLVAEFKSRLKSFACEACAFDFEKRYGPLGNNFIECHHVRPVAEMRPGEKTKLSELRAVCSNCHRMLHKSPNPITIEKLREMLRLQE